MSATLALMLKLIDPKSKILILERLDKLKQRFPLIMEDRDPDEVMAATRMELGTGIDFGTLTETYFKILEEHFDTPTITNHEVFDIDPDIKADWLVNIKNMDTDEILHNDAKHVFIGAGGGALPLLQKVEIDEKDGYGGFKRFKKSVPNYWS